MGGVALGAGTTVVRGKHFWGGSHIGYNRMNFRGPDYSSFQISPGSHMDQVATHWYRKGPIPVTINIGIPPTCTMTAGSGPLGLSTSTSHGWHGTPSARPLW